MPNGLNGVHRPTVTGQLVPYVARYEGEGSYRPGARPLLSVSEQLFISEATVKTHLNRVYAKLGVKRRGQAVARALEMGMAEV
ncbi:LuxR C-terminal-related transcriptional regulator [Paenibacillus sp. J5C_2022]|nr:LuxR C-terminal-related transcriptional regulator [Paenibacillus sp. J5C2022]